MQKETSIEPEWFPFGKMVRTPGEHILVVGSTGTGKTQLLYFVLERMREWGKKESFVWFDSGKSAEILVLAQFGPITLHIPAGNTIRVETKDPALMERIQVKEFYHPAELWDNLEPGRINVFCIEPYFSDPKIFSITITEIFRELIIRARDYSFEKKGMIPLAVFMDEIQWLVPNEHSALNRQHNEGAKWFQRNIEYLRSLGVRVVGATQGWTKLRPGARDSFSWLLLKRGARFGIDKPNLNRSNRLWETLNDDEFVLVRPDSVYVGKKYATPFYGTGRKLGRVYYREVRPE